MGVFAIDTAFYPSEYQTQQWEKLRLIQSKTTPLGRCFLPYLEMRELKPELRV
jgi:hypothetical protein